MFLGGWGPKKPSRYSLSQIDLHRSNSTQQPKNISTSKPPQTSNGPLSLPGNFTALRPPPLPDRCRIPFLTPYKNEPFIIFPSWLPSLETWHGYLRVSNFRWHRQRSLSTRHVCVPQHLIYETFTLLELLPPLPLQMTGNVSFITGQWVCDHFLPYRDRPRKPKTPLSPTLNITSRGKLLL